MLLNGSALNTTAINGAVELTIQAVCSLARSRVEADSQAEIGAHVRLTAIDKPVLDLAMSWRKKYLTNGKGDHEPGWDWREEFYRRGQKSSGVNLAIWAGAELCGLMIGQVSDGRLHATIHFIEGNPAGNQLKGHVVNIATHFIEAVGFLVGCEKVRISRPDPRLIPFYKEFGYTVEERKHNIVKFLDKPLLDEQSQELPGDLSA